MEESGQDKEAASEVRHRTANTLQLLATLARMRGQKSTEAEVRRQMTWMAEAIGALGALERQRSGDGVDLAGYLQEMAPVWRRRQASLGTEVTVTTVPCCVRDQVASTLALIANELVANGLQHGLAGGARRLDIRLENCGPAEMRLVVEDDGPGFGPERGPERFGLWLARSLAAQIRGALVLEGAEGGGTRASLRFPN